ncbi:CoA transferase [Nocardioides acrostichi]|uniref:CoA transferase n=1 Tax=Nocardioides acrostichi TaxID=2784339 RepID=A0A930YBQ5_9ACTN|nr:CoA transferase [Nocardioides acrostichi]MBF4162713.1 CoA transferase [Nocardioides acrostichi]
MLDDIVVLEVGTRVSTAYAGRLLRDAGAVVARLEAPGSGDPIRTEDPAYAEYLHAGKASVTDLLGAGHGLADRIDVVLHDDRADVAGMLAQLRSRRRSRRRHLVVVSVSPYGLDGPHAATPANDFTMQAETGLSRVHDTGGRPSVAAGVPLAELTGGAAAAMAAVVALLADDAAESSITADVSLFEAAVSLQQYPWLQSRIEHHDPYPLPQAPVPGIEEASDGWVCIVSVTPDQWKDLARIAQVPGLADPRFDSLGGRIVHAAEVTPLIREFTRRHTVEELVEMGAAHRVPIVPVGTPGSVASLAPFAARGSFARSVSGDFVAPRSPFTVDGAVADVEALAAPGLDDGRDWSAGPARRRSASPDADPQRPLTGLKVVEIGTFQAGPLVTMNLASLGAEVVKIETVNRPDLIRFNGVAMTVDRAWERGGPFLGVNLGKKDVVADLADPRGLAVVRDLVAEADVVLENFGPRVLESRGLDAEGIRALNPHAVIVRMPAWGLDGPWRDRPGFTYTVNAASGMADLTGYPDGDALLSGTVVDPFAATVGSFATIAAIRRRRVTGRGASVVLPLCDVAIQLTAEAVVHESATGRVVRRTGNDRPGLCPQGAYRTADGAEVAVSVEDDAQWARLAALPWVGEWAGDPRFATTAGRAAATEELDALLSRACGALVSTEVIDDLRGIGVPASRFEVGDDLVLHPQLVARHRVVEIDHPVVGPQPYLAGPAVFTGGPSMLPTAPAPLFGQHSDEILRRLGRTDEEIARMRADGLLADSPFNAPFDRTAAPR